MKILKFFLDIILVGLLLFGSIFVGYSLSLKDRIYHNIYVSGINIGKLTKDQASELLKKKYQDSTNELSFYNADEEILKIKANTVSRDIDWVVNQAYTFGRSGNVIVDIKTVAELLFKNKDLNMPVAIEDEELNDIVDTVAQKVELVPVYAKLVKNSDGYSLVEGKNGKVLDKTDLVEKIKYELSLVKADNIDVKVDLISTKTNTERVESVLELMNSWNDKKFKLFYKDFNMNLSEEEVLDLISLSDNFFVPEKIEALVAKIAGTIETEPKDATFEFSEGKVKEFSPEVLGVKIDLPDFVKILEEDLLAGKDRLEIPVINEEPKVKVSDINNYGIKELLGVGTSTFTHSIPGRVFNVNLAASRISGTLVPPGEDFSFNSAVGEISRATGYQTAYVISEGKTVLGDGGGVCQVSTTVFRAALNFGFPITERKAHAYRVGYYEQDSPPGIDATIFSPSTDLKFLNDTGHYILIQTKVDTKNLTMRVEIYGTSDGRKSEISKPVISSQSPAPAAMYVDDPTLPKGTTKQIDWAASGAKVSFDYKVTRDGETLTDKTFYSNYQPWRAVYLVGTKE